MTKTANKRKFKRENCFVPVDGKQGSVFENLQTVDFSKDGMGFVSTKKVPVNKKIAVELDLDDSENPVFVIGKVRWVRSDKDTGYYRIGMHFEDVLNGSKSRLQKYFKKT